MSPRACRVIVLAALGLVWIALPLHSAPGPVPSAAELIALVAGAHDPDADPPVDCLACHGGIYAQPALALYWNESTAELVVNQHRAHRDHPMVDFGSDCTFCHAAFQVVTTPELVSVQGAVDKATCAACHARFSPRGWMDQGLLELSKNPPEDDPTCTCACCHFGWPVLHANAEITSQFVLDLSVGGDARDCLSCHGENPFQVPGGLQSAFWLERESLMGPSNTE